MVYKTKTGCNHMLTKFKSCTRRNGKLTSRQQQQENNEELGAGEMSKPRGQAAIHTQTRFQAASRPWHKLEPSRTATLFKLALQGSIASDLGFLLPSQAVGFPLETSPNTVKDTDLPLEYIKVKYHRKDAVTVRGKTRSDKTVDCLEYIAIMASAI